MKCPRCGLLHRGLLPAHVAGRGLLCACGQWLRDLSGAVDCPDEPAPPAPAIANRPNVAEAAGRYSAAVARWLAAGRPERNGDELEAVLACCRACPLFDAAGGRCGHPDCGCNLDAAAAAGWWAELGRLALRMLPGLSPALFSKARMRTENCPAGRWPEDLITTPN